VRIYASFPLHISGASSHRTFPRANGAAPPRSTVWRSVPLAISEPGAKLLPILDRCSGTGREKASNRSDWSCQSDDAKPSGTKETGFHLETATQLERVLNSFVAHRRARDEMRSPNAEALAFRSQPGGPLLEDHDTESRTVSSTHSTASTARGICTGFDGDATRWELAGINLPSSAHRWDTSSHRITGLYSGEIPLDQVCAAFSSKLLEKMEH
jgi:hypothetical protein